MLGELLDWATVPGISNLEVDGSDFTAHKDLGSGTTAIVKGSFPTVFSWIKIQQASQPNLKAKMAAKKSRLTI